MNVQHIFGSLIVSSGLFNTTFACLTKYQEKRCIIIDKHLHLGRNIMICIYDLKGYGHSDIEKHIKILSLYYFNIGLSIISKKWKRLKS